MEDFGKATVARDDPIPDREELNRDFTVQRQNKGALHKTGVQRSKWGKLPPTAIVVAYAPDRIRFHGRLFLLYLPQVSPTICKHLVNVLCFFALASAARVC